MPYLKLTTPSLSEADRERVARELTEAVVRLMTPANGRGLSADELRERCTVHFTPYEPTSLAIGGILMRDRPHQDYTAKFHPAGTTRFQMLGSTRFHEIGTTRFHVSGAT
jgi:hypothetical protein